VLQQALVSPTRTAQDSTAEQETKTSSTAGNQGGGLLGLVRSSVIVRIGTEVGKRLLEAGKEIVGDLSSLVGEAVSAAQDFGSDVMGKVTSAFTNVLGILPSALQDFVGNLGKGESKSLAQLEQLDAEVNQNLDKMEADSLNGINKSESEGVDKLQQIYNGAATALSDLDASVAEQGEDVIAARVDELVGKTMEAMLETRTSATELMAGTREALESAASQAPTRFGAEVSTITGATKSGLNDARSGFFGGLKAVVEQGLSAVQDVVTGVGDAIGDFLGNIGDKLGEIVSSLASWATNSIRSLGQAFANGTQRGGVRKLV
jgi:hypothetical protein